jgi:hypothetical protein
MKRKLVTVPDEEVEPFTKSECSCNVCKEINECEREWDSFSVKTNLQRRMKDVVLSIQIKAENQLEPNNIPSRKRKSRK